MDVTLNFINESTDGNHVSILVFQKNPMANALPIAWTVIENLTSGTDHFVVVSVEMEVSASNPSGNSSPQLPAAPGQQFRMMQTTSGDQLVASGAANAAAAVEVANALSNGAIDASVYKANRLLAVRTGVAPGQTAAFEFKPTIWVGVVSQVTQGQVLDSATVANVDTEIALTGIASAEVVVTGGPGGVGAAPFVFTLMNVVTA
jgi:hypothetical protein